MSDAVREARKDVIQCASTMNADNEIDGWQGNVNINLALDALIAVVRDDVLREIFIELDVENVLTQSMDQAAKGLASIERPVEFWKKFAARAREEGRGSEAGLVAE